MQLNAKEMSTASKVTLGVSVLVTAGIISAVHLKKKSDSEKLREGVYRDLERQERKRKNQAELVEQTRLTSILREEQEKYDEQSTNG